MAEYAPNIVVRCQEDWCPKKGTIINTISKIKTIEDRELILEQWKEAYDDPEDVCNVCGAIGVPDEDYEAPEVKKATQWWTFCNLCGHKIEIHHWDDHISPSWIDIAAMARKIFPWWMRPFVRARTERLGSQIMRETHRRECKKLHPKNARWKRAHNGSA
jgi:hypothetical protein